VSEPLRIAVARYFTDTTVTLIAVVWKKPPGFTQLPPVIGSPVSLAQIENGAPLDVFSGRRQCAPGMPKTAAAPLAVAVLRSARGKLALNGARRTNVFSDPASWLASAELQTTGHRQSKTAP